MRILIVGGTGLISGALASQAAAAGHELTLVTRGRSSTPAPPGARTIHADATDATAMRDALHGMRLRRERFDAVVQSVAFRPEHVADDVATFAPLTDQYALIATSAAYATYPHYHPLTEDTPQENPYWEYARLKADCERVLRDAAGPAGLGWTVVRPAHTYGDSKIPSYIGNSRAPWTLVDRMRRGADIIVPGDGTSLWTLTHADDVAAGILGLLGNADALGRAVHITSDVPHTWRGILATVAEAAGLTPAQFDAQAVCVPTDAMVAVDPSLEGGTRGDKMHAAIYDTSLIRTLVPGWEARVPLDEGIRRAVDWFEADPARQVVDAADDALLDRLGAVYRDALARVRE
ncbi:NAD-dependent epimerase/dehydratase family protein [Demequina pelophila]|uniref:NAD-dependent epimerase/dehydratase family protein n=1 Tax=Demequina pelophila TaxID=1638984 RepID=UPI00078679F9|nr:NAD-dependent epimerase/dehydratase family protein [Demequina pelophila]